MHVNHFIVPYPTNDILARYRFHHHVGMDVIIPLSRQNLLAMMFFKARFVAAPPAPEEPTRYEYKC